MDGDGSVPPSSELLPNYVMVVNKCGNGGQAHQHNPSRSTGSRSTPSLLTDHAGQEPRDPPNRHRRDNLSDNEQGHPLHHRSMDPRSCRYRTAMCRSRVRVRSSSSRNKKIFDDDKKEAIMLVDATNAFNSLNRKSAF